MSTTDEWEDLLRRVGLGAGIHEPLRTEVIKGAMVHLAPMLAAHDREVAAKALRDAAAEASRAPADSYKLAAWLRDRADRIEEDK